MGKGCGGGGGGGGNSVLRKLNRKATTRGTCVLEVIGIIALRGFLRLMIHAGSSSTGSTFQWQAPRRGDTKTSPPVVVKQFDDRKKRSCWEWQPYIGAMTDLPRQIREQIQSHRQRVDVALKRGAKRVRR